MNFGFTSGKARQSAPTKKWTEREIQAKIQEFDAKIEEAKEREGDVEVRDAILDKAEWIKDEAKGLPTGRAHLPRGLRDVRWSLSQNGNPIPNHTHELGEVRHGRPEKGRHYMQTTRG